MKIIIDVMGGDKGPAEVVKGAVEGCRDLKTDVILVGDQTVIRSVAAENKLDLTGIRIVHASDVITMEDDPMSIRKKENASMRVALKLLSDGEGDALVSCGNTGALQTGATLYVKRIRGVHRAAIATLLPLTCPTLLLDSGANISVTEEHMTQFAIMGSVYMEKLYKLQSPRVGLLNNGTEERKGTPLQQETHQWLKECDVNFIGNVEGKDIPFGKCDVIVTDGFTGNIALKSLEGMASFVVGKFKAIFKSGILGLASAALIKKKLDVLGKQMDTRSHGGAPLLGISRAVIKAHGNSDALAIKNAMRQAVNYVNTNVISEISKRCAAESMKRERME
ncbi:MAG: phosphate acyltransferase PlsX [Clostridia bacterium]|nr:phosphate acyltransferase PlsX [Clostridia bacterium]